MREAYMKDKNRKDKISFTTLGEQMSQGGQPRGGQADQHKGGLAAAMGQGSIYKNQHTPAPLHERMGQ